MPEREPKEIKIEQKSNNERKVTVDVDTVVILNPAFEISLANKLSTILWSVTDVCSPHNDKFFLDTTNNNNTNNHNINSNSNKNKKILTTSTTTTTTTTTIIIIIMIITTTRIIIITTIIIIIQIKQYNHPTGKI